MSPSFPVARARGTWPTAERSLAELDLPWQHFAGPLAFVDLETTGFSPDQRDRIVEIAIVRLERGAPPRVLDTLIDPQGRVGPTFVHGITLDQVRDAPPFAALAEEVERLLDGATLVAHNAEFEVRFLAAELRRCGRSVRARRLCTLQLSRALLPDRRGRGAHTLARLCATYGVPLVDAHAAFPDAVAVAGLLAALARGHAEALDAALRSATQPLVIAEEPEPIPAPSGEVARRRTWPVALAVMLLVALAALLATAWAALRS